MKNNEETKAKINLLIAMSIFGTMGIFVKNIDAPSSFLCLCRGFFGGLFITAVMLISGRRFDKKAIKNNLWLLIISGATMGFNWMMMFEAYKYTTVAIATLLYYLQSVYISLAAPWLLKEKLSVKKLICVLVALIGMVLVTGAFGGGEGRIHPTGLILGLGAGLLYAVVVIINKKMGDIPAYDCSVCQLWMAAIVMIPYCMATMELDQVSLKPLSLICMAIICFGHTGMAYVLYFGSVHKLKAQTVAILGYIDPILAVILSAVLLKEPFGWNCFAGAVLILGSTFISEYNFKKKGELKAR